MSRHTLTAQQYWDARSELFANYYKEPSWFDKVFRKAVFIRAAVALDTIRSFDRPTVLDIGSGPGVNSVTWLKNSNATHVLGIDFAENMNEYARRNAEAEGVGDRCSFVQGDFLTYDFKGRTFTVAVAAGVVDYVKDTATFMKILDAVTTGAYVVSWPENGLRMALRRFRYTTPVYHYDEADIRRLHEGANIKKLDILPMQGGRMSVAWK
jgi:SAM-dependent methyltransferase